MGRGSRNQQLAALDDLLDGPQAQTPKWLRVPTPRVMPADARDALAPPEWEPPILDEPQAPYEQLEALEDRGLLRDAVVRLPVGLRYICAGRQFELPAAASVIVREVLSRKGQWWICWHSPSGLAYAPAEPVRAVLEPGTHLPCSRHLGNNMWLARCTCGWEQEDDQHSSEPREKWELHVGELLDLKA